MECSVWHLLMKKEKEKENTNISNLTQSTNRISAINHVWLGLNVLYQRLCDHDDVLSDTWQLFDNKVNHLPQGGLCAIIKRESVRCTLIFKEEAMSGATDWSPLQPRVCIKVTYAMIIESAKIKRSLTSLDWNSLVTLKNNSVASFVPKGSPRYSK